MKTIVCLACVVLPIHFAASATAQGIFENLDFEQGSISAPPGIEPDASVAVPDWNVYLNGSRSYHHRLR
jgi:hypothetical protein